MLLTIIVTISSLVIFNLFLLKISCNSIPKIKKIERQAIPLKTDRDIIKNTEKLAPTGS